jgi:aspartate kinase
MSLIVQKFGGTSVGSPERIQKVAERIAHAHQAGNQLVVVVSAMGHTTDELIELAHEVSRQPPHREMDMLLSAGERISMALLSMALADCKVPALSLTGSQTGIITDSSHRRARIQRILGDRVRTALGDGKVVIVAGFQGVSETREITTLGRGGSDTTAVALAAALQAEKCEIYTDVDGVFSADPRLVEDAKVWNQIPHDLMVELATRGAGVLHPRSVELAKQFGVQLVVKNSLKESRGTRVVSRLSDNQQKKGMEEFAIVGVTADTNKMFIEVELARSTVVGALWDQAAHSHLSVVAPFFSKNTVSFYSDLDAEGEWKKILEHLGTEGFVKDFHLRSDVVPLSVVGDRFSQDGLALAQVLDCLARAQVDVLIGSASALAITVGVAKSQVEQGLRTLHSEFLGRK